MLPLLLQAVLPTRVPLTQFIQTLLVQHVDYQAQTGYLGLPSGQAHYLLCSQRGRGLDSPLPGDELLLWLGESSGRPGASALKAAFTQIGPVTISNISNVTKVVNNPYAWNQHSYLLFVDPLNVGFSYSSLNSTSSTFYTLAYELNLALRSFYNEHRGLAGLPLFLGASGLNVRTVMALGEILAREGTVLGGVVGLAPQLSPLTQSNSYDSVLYSVGLLDRTQRDELSWRQTQLISSVFNGNSTSAFDCYQHILGKNYSASLSNYRTVDPRKDDAWSIFLQTYKANFTGQTDFKPFNEALNKAFSNDTMLGYTEQLKFLLNNKTKVMLLAGQNDISAGPASLQLMANSVNWNEARPWRREDKRVLHQSRNVIGWVKQHSSLHLGVVYEAGKGIARDQPVSAEFLWRWFVSSQ